MTQPARHVVSLGLVLSLVLACVLVLGCAHAARRPYPTLEEYSDGTSRLVSDFRTALQARDRTTLERLCSETYVLTPAMEAQTPPFRSPSGLSVERFVAQGEPTEQSLGAKGAGTVEEAGASATDEKEERGTSSTELPPVSLPKSEALSYLLEHRQRFIGIVLNTARIAGIQGRGDSRTLLVHTTVHGLARGGVRTQEDALWRWEVVRRPDLPEGWSITKAVEERRTLVNAPEPIFTQVYPDESSPAWRPGTKRPEETRSVASPGAHDTGGVAVLDDCVEGGACILVGGGDGIAALSRGNPSAEAPYQDRAAMLHLEGSYGETKSLLAADFNNDGVTDLFVTYDDAPCRLYRGQRLLEDSKEGRIEHLGFEEITAASGLEGLVGPYRTAIALDADRDGWLDLYVVQYGDSSRTGPSTSGRNGLPNRLFRNVTQQGGAIRFVDESRASGADDAGWGLSAAAADYDGDGRIDIYVANDFGPNVLYRNVTEPRGPIRFQHAEAQTETRDPSFGMGVSWGDYDLDGDLDLYVSNYWFDERWIFTDPRFPLPPYALRRLAAPFAKKRLVGMVAGNSLYRNDVKTSGRFVRVSEQAGVFDGGWSWGNVWTDIDGDGLQDLVVANGMLVGKGGPGREVDFWNEMSAGWKDFSKGKFTIDFGEDGITGPQTKRIFLNLGDGTFADVGFAAGLDTTADLRGLVAADVTRDGAPDLIGGAFLDSPVILENTNAGHPPRVLVKLEGTTSNWDAVGAVVRVTAGGKTQTRQVSAGGSFLSDGGRALDFALGPSGVIDEIQVDWPSGSKTVLQKPVPRRGVLIITETAKAE